MESTRKVSMNREELLAKIKSARNDDDPLANAIEHWINRYKAGIITRWEYEVAITESALQLSIERGTTQLEAYAQSVDNYDDGA